MDRDELGAWLRLTLSPGVGNAAARRLLARFGLPQEIFRQAEHDLRHCVTAAQASALATLPEGWASLLDAPGFVIGVSGVLPSEPQVDCYSVNR